MGWYRLLPRKERCGVGGDSKPDIIYFMEDKILDSELETLCNNLLRLTELPKEDARHLFWRSAGRDKLKAAHGKRSYEIEKVPRLTWPGNSINLNVYASTQLLLSTKLPLPSGIFPRPGPSRPSPLELAASALLIAVEGESLQERAKIASDVEAVRAINKGFEL